MRVGGQGRMGEWVGVGRWMWVVGGGSGMGKEAGEGCALVGGGWVGEGGWGGFAGVDADVGAKVCE